MNMHAVCKNLNQLILRNLDENGSQFISGRSFRDFWIVPLESEPFSFVFDTSMTNILVREDQDLTSQISFWNVVINDDFLPIL